MYKFCVEMYFCFFGVNIYVSLIGKNQSDFLVDLAVYELTLFFGLLNVTMAWKALSPNFVCLTPFLHSALLIYIYILSKGFLCLTFSSCPFPALVSFKTLITFLHNINVSFFVSKLNLKVQVDIVTASSSLPSL